MKSIRRFLIFIIVVIIGLAVTNPDKHKHLDKIVEKYNEENPLSGAFGAGKFLENVVAYENHYFYSVGKISIANESVSFGIAGFVVVYKSLDLMKYKDMIPK